MKRRLKDHRGYPVNEKKKLFEEKAADVAKNGSAADTYSKSEEMFVRKKSKNAKP